MINLGSKSGLSEQNHKGRDFNGIQYTYTGSEFCGLKAHVKFLLHRGYFKYCLIFTKYKQDCS